ncbi:MULTISPECIES: hypothetical protein [unclassified Streptomyces]|uniref:hypothetical protein n=1 Tax=unclassified Streptomyces TaxID=2593676 RepID=UPI000CD4E9BE|nr:MULTISPECIES: hypothetical protein [unclassified Streptomyces]
MRPRTARTLTTAAAAVLLTAALTACSGDGEGFGASTGEKVGELGELTDGLSEELAQLEDLELDLPDGWDGGTELAEGDCWGRADTVDHAPRSCDQPHVFEVVGVQEGFVPTADDLFAVEEEKEAVCADMFATYFGHAFDAQQPPHLDLTPEPTVVGTDASGGITVVCSVYTTRTEEHTGSFR